MLRTGLCTHRHVALSRALGTVRRQPVKQLLSPRRTHDVFRGLAVSERRFYSADTPTHAPKFSFDNVTVEPTISPEEAERILAEWKANYRLSINTVMEAIVKDKTFRSYINSKAIDSTNWENFVRAKRRDLVLDPLSALGNIEEVVKLKELLDDAFHRVETNAIGSNNTAFSFCKQTLFELLLKEAEVQLKDVVDANRVLASTSDLRIPHEWFPHARIMKRKIFYHGGPTNSGKTYTAIQRLKQADPAFGGGLYCGPLRLLALEIYEQLNRQGVSIDLLTGQEQKNVPGATHVSCTIEMISTNKEYDVAVIDEIQMIADPERGHSWTKALLGLRAREIHVCGGLEAAQLVESLCKSTHDEFTLVKYDRLSTLQIEEQSLQGDYSKVQPGDCIVAFSIADIFAIRREIEARTKHKCAVIYGQLPSETRSTQARLFNDPSSGYDVLVASDAIGMGLNLNIRRIIFHTTLKRRGSTVEGSFFMDPSSIKQIAGRAGRKSSNFPIGYVSAWQEVDLAYIKAVMQMEIPPIKAAGLFPTAPQIQLFYELVKKVFTDQMEEAKNNRLPSSADEKKNKKSKPDVKEKDESMEHDFRRDPENMRVSMIISRFVELSKIDTRYFMSNHDTLLVISNWLQTIPLSMSDRFTFANAPVGLNFSLNMLKLYVYAATYATKRPVPLGIHLPKHVPRDVMEFGELCLKHNCLDLYLWLSFRFPKYFIERKNALEMKQRAINFIEIALSTKKLRDSYSYRESYADLRRAAMLSSPTATGDRIALPPIEFGEKLREATKQLILSIPPHLRSVVKDPQHPEKDLEIGRRRGPHMHSNFRDRKHSDSRRPNPRATETLQMENNSNNSKTSSIEEEVQKIESNV